MHPQSLAAFLANSLLSSPVHDSNYSSRIRGRASSDASDRQRIRPKDSPAQIIYRPRLAEAFSRSWIDFLLSKANAAFREEPLPDRDQIVFEEKHRDFAEEPDDYREASFNDQGGALTSLVCRLAENVDKHLPPTDRAGHVSHGTEAQNFENEPDVDGVKITFGTRCDAYIKRQGVFHIIFEYKNPSASHILAGSTAIFTKLFQIFGQNAQHTLKSLAAADGSVWRLMKKIIASCTSRGCRTFVFLDYVNYFYGFLAPHDQEVGMAGDFDAVFSPLLKIDNSSHPLASTLTGLLYYDRFFTEELVSLVEEAVVEAALLQKELPSKPLPRRSSRQSGGGGGSGRRISASGFGNQGPQEDGEELRDVASIEELVKLSGFMYTFPDGSKAEVPYMKRICPAELLAEPTGPTCDAMEELALDDEDLAESSFSTCSTATSATPSCPPSPAPSFNFSPRRRNVEVLAHVQLVDLVGRGATSTVWRAYVGDESDRHHHSFVMKLPHRNDADARFAYANEAEVLERLQDAAYVVRGLGLYKSSDRRWSMCAIQEDGGRALLDWDELSEKERFSLYYNVASLHLDYGITHGDIRPENVVLDTNDAGRVVRLADFAQASIEECPGHDECGELRALWTDLRLDEADDE